MKPLVAFLLVMHAGSALAVDGADPRPRVEVLFRLAEPVYQKAFPVTADPGQAILTLASFETSVARALESVLSARIQYLQFGPGTNAYLLKVTLDRQQTGNTSTRLVPTILGIELALGQGRSVRLEREFRPAREYIAPVVSENFQGEITNRFSNLLRVDLGSLVKEIFCYVPLGKEVYLCADQQDLFCVLPFSYSDIGADQDTAFEFETQRAGTLVIDQHHGARGVMAPPGGLTNVPAAYRLGIPAVEDESVVRTGHDGRRLKVTRFRDLSVTNGLVQGRGLYITDYIPMATPERGTTPPTLVFGQ
jgi:hypothetical protein